MVEKRLTLKKGEDAARLSTIILLTVSVLKGFASLASGSIALLAGTIDSFSDVFSSAAVWIGLRIAKKKPTERFPYGYYKAETFALLVVSLIIMSSSVLIMIESFEKFFEVSALSFSDLALAVAALSAIIYYLLAKYKARVGRQIGSQALISEGLHSMIDVYTSALVFLGVLLTVIGYPVGEALIGLMIGAYVLSRGFLYGKDAALVLMDISPSPQMARQMRGIAESVRGVKGTHNIRLRKSGPVFFGEMHVELQEGLSLEKAHVISDEVEKRVKERFKDLELVTVHVGISHKRKKRVAIPILENKGLESTVSRHFGSTRYFAFIDIEEGQEAGLYVKENEGSRLQSKKGIQAAHLLIEEKADALLTMSIGEGPFHILGDNLIEIYHLPESMSIQEAIRKLGQNLIRKMVTPTEKLQDVERK